MVVWKPVKGFEHYEISNEGKVRHGTTKRHLKGRTHSQGLSYRLTSPDDGIGSTPICDRALSRLMRENWRYEWIKELDDDEVVKPVQGKPSYYITSKARLFSLNKYDWVVPKPHKNDERYETYVRINRQINVLSRLVGKHFLADFDESLFVLHKDEDLPFPNVHFPSNLFMGTIHDNSMDMVRKGRSRQILSRDDVREMRGLCLTHTISEIAEMYGVSYHTVRNAIHRLSPCYDFD